MNGDELFDMFNKPSTADERQCIDLVQVSTHRPLRRQLKELNAWGRHKN